MQIVINYDSVSHDRAIFEIRKSGSIDEDEMKSLGQKVEDAEVKKFIEVTKLILIDKFEANCNISR